VPQKHKLRLALSVSHLFETPNPQAEKILELVEVLEIKKLPEPTWLPQDKKKVFHTGLGLVEEDFISEFFKINDYLNQQNIQLFSCDLGPAAEKYSQIYPISKVLSAEEIEIKINKTVAIVRDKFKGQVAVENYNYYPTGLYEHICQPDYITRITKSLRLGLVLDLAHAAVSAYNLELDLLAYIKALPLELVTEIHLSRPYLPNSRKQTAYDAHYCPSQREYQWLAELVKLIPANSQEILLVIEYYGSLTELYQTMSYFKDLQG
jgi:uncharacterized protein (UPF0276 family)